MASLGSAVRVRGVVDSGWFLDNDPFTAPGEQRAARSPAATVSTGAQLKGDGGCAERDRDKVIKLFHPGSKRTYYFAGTQPAEVER